MIDPDDVEAALADQEPPEARVKALAMDLGEPPDQVRYTVNQMDTWGVVETDEHKVRLVNPTPPEGASDVACPLGCGYRPETARGAFAHLLAHALGRHTTGRDQRRTTP